MSFARALEIGRAPEAAGKNAREIMASKVVDKTEEAGGEAAVHRMQPQMPRTCYRCGQSGLSPTKCRFKEAKCFACKKVGHLSQVCRSKGQGKKSSRIMKTQPKLPTTYQVEQAEDDEEESLELKHL